MIQNLGYVDKLKLVDIELESISESIATLGVNIVDKKASGSYPSGFLDGSNWGCRNAVDGARALTTLLNRNYHNTAYPIGTFFVSITDPAIEVSTVDAYDYINGGNIYWGTNESLGGLHWLYSGPNTSDAICFPDRWNKLSLLRQNRINFWNIPENMDIIWEVVDWTEVNRVGTPFEYGSIYYPMGPYDHSWFVRIGYPVYIRD